MSNGELLSIEPQELQFPFELKKQISCSMQLANKTSNCVAFKVKTTNPKKYCVRPNTGIILPHSTCDVIVTMQAQKETPLDMQCKDKFLLQSAVISGENIGATAKDITPEMFNKDLGNHVEECKLRVSYVPPPQPPSPVQEGSEEDTSPRASVSENGTTNTSDSHAVSRAYVEPHENSSEFYIGMEKMPSKQPSINGLLTTRVDKQSIEFLGVRALISKLSEEKNSAIQQNNKLHQELELLRREGNKSRGGIPFIYVFLVGLLGILLGYLMKRT